MRLAGKIAVVTGAGSGIGRAIAVRFAREGAGLALVDRDPAGLEASRALVEAAGAAVLARVADVGAPGAADADAAAVLAEFRRIDCLVTAAGFSSGGTVTTTDPADWAAVQRVNVDGTWLWARAVIPAMERAGGGSIVTVASQLALAGGRNNSAYLAAKGAVISLTRTMALDHAAAGIRVNALVPGAILTPLLERGFARQADPEAARERSRLRHALGRFGTAEEVANAALFLASDEASFTTGSMLMVDGGWLAG